ncbi:CRISPR-associated endoribonuclease Cas6 [Persephonella atlantica]|uniref:CRISPR-associated endoribonuclease Cas6 n=1 Tax=Persephonella atlantica TaxID=2699429 RepID=A0ABS1GJK4_9AQUI|nr:CRISPR-associated endoribonuclease Cas6 [Persephonella atlantica]MBK3333112.1 CRISPR-associated endoribonuclease Cas6 [Persephonella atlantica]
MRIKILIKSNKVPFLYRHRVVSLIKEALKKSDSDYKDFLYNNQITKPFSFNLVFPQKRQIQTAKIQIDENFEIEDKIVISDGYFSLFVSSIDYRFIIGLFNGLKRLKTFQFSSNTDMLVNGEKISWQIKNISVLNERPIKKETVIFKTNSPVIVEDRDDRPVLFNEERFEKELNEVMDRILKSPHIKGKGLEKPLRFKPLVMKKSIIKHTLKSFREHTGKPVMYLTGNSGVFKLSGHPEDLKILYEVGIGTKTGQGFGMVEVL